MSGDPPVTVDCEAANKERATAAVRCSDASCSSIARRRVLRCSSFLLLAVLGARLRLQPGEEGEERLLLGNGRLLVGDPPRPVHDRLPPLRSLEIRVGSFLRGDRRLFAGVVHG